MKAIFLIAACALLACNKDNSADTTRTTGASATTADTADNTKLNERDRNSDMPTSGDQSNSKVDIDITAQIRRQIVADGALSTDAKNVKIVSRDGAVVLRGPVASEAEKNAIGSKASGVAGVKNVENDLDIIPQNRGNQ